LLCTFSVHNITVTHNVLLSEHTGADRHSTICYVDSVCTTLLYHTMCCCQNTPVKTVTVQFVMYVQCAQNYCNTQCAAVRTHRYRPSQYNLLCRFSVHNITVLHNVLLSEHNVTGGHSTICYVGSVCTTLLYHTMCCCQNTPVQTVTVQFVMYVQCPQNYCNTQCAAVRTHRYRPSQYNLLCTFSVHNITVTHYVLLSEHTGTARHSTICYVRSVCTTLL